jgi:hypothetical protein
MAGGGGADCAAEADCATEFDAPKNAPPNKKSRTLAFLFINELLAPFGITFDHLTMTKSPKAEDCVEHEVPHNSVILQGVKLAINW